VDFAVFVIHYYLAFPAFAGGLAVLEFTG